MILHIVSRSPHAHDALQRCLAVAAATDALMLIEDGVYALAAARSLLPEAGVVTGIYALQPDLDARGITLPAAGPVQIVDYAGFVDLTARFDKTLSWF